MTGGAGGRGDEGTAVAKVPAIAHGGRAVQLRVEDVEFAGSDKGVGDRRRNRLRPGPLQEVTEQFRPRGGRNLLRGVERFAHAFQPEGSVDALASISRAGALQPRLIAMG